MWRSDRPSRWAACRLRRPGAAPLLAAMVAVLLGWPQPAAAHTGLVASTPTAGAVVGAMPSRVRLVFSQDVEPRFLDVLLNGAGTSVTLRATARGRAVVAPVPVAVTTSMTPGGPWRLRYRVVSSDGHPVAGSVRFRVRGPVSLAPPSGAGGTPRADGGPDHVQSEPKGSGTDEGARRPWQWVVPLLLAVSVLGVAAYGRLRRS